MIKTLIFFILVLIPLTAHSQSKEQAENIFLKELNNILHNSAQQHWKYNGKMSIDSAFSINEDGRLSITVSYESDSSIQRVRMEAPIKKAKSVEYDLYLILEFDQNEVIVSESEINNNDLVEKFRTKLFHIGIPAEEGEEWRQKLQYLLNRILKFY